MARGDFKQRVIFELVDQASGPASRIQTAFGGISKTLAALGAGAVVGKVFGELVEFLNSGAEAAAKAETATTKLRAALENSAPGAIAFADALGRQADELQKLGSVNAEAVQGVQALLANIGVAGSQLELATQASIDLSAALGISLESAAAQVGKTVNGVTGRLGALVPELTKLSTESLAAGEGIALLAEQFSGQAAKQATTYANSIARLNEAFEDTAEALGGGLAGESVSTSIRNFAAALEVLNSEVEQSGFSQWLGSVKTNLTNLASGLTVGAANLLSFSDAMGSSSEATRAAAEASLAAQEAFEAEARAIEARETAQRKAAQAQADFLEATKDLGATLEGSVNTAIEKNNALLIEADEQYRLGTITRADFERVERAVAAANREASASIIEVGATLETVEEGYGTAGDAADTYRARVDELTAAANRATAAQIALGSAMGVTARDRRSQDEVDAAIAAGRRPYLGGTRIRTADGSGSRLIR